MDTKLYRGARTGPDMASDSYVHRVLADGTVTELPPCTDLANHSPTGFNWGYGGSGPAQLALAIVSDLLGGASPIADALAVMVYQDVKWHLIAPLAADRWELPADKVRAAIAYLMGKEMLGLEAFRDIAENVALKYFEKEFGEEPPEGYEFDYDQAYKTLTDKALTEIQGLLASRLRLKLELLAPCGMNHTANVLKGRDKANLIERAASSRKANKGGRGKGNGSNRGVRGSRLITIYWLQNATNNLHAAGEKRAELFYRRLRKSVGG